MKKVKFEQVWGTLPVATPNAKGLMSSANTIGIHDSVKMVKLINTDVGYLIGLDIAMTTACNIIIRLTEHRYITGNPAIKTIALYPTQLNANKSTSVETSSQAEILNLNGKIAAYISPANTSGYASLVEVFAVNTLGEVINPGVSIIVSEKPAGATVVTTL